MELPSTGDWNVTPSCVASVDCQKMINMEDKRGEERRKKHRKKTSKVPLLLPITHIEKPFESHPSPSTGSCMKQVYACMYGVVENTLRFEKMPKCNSMTYLFQFMKL